MAADGESSQAIAKALGVTIRTVRRWIFKAKQEPSQASKPRGKKCNLDAQQLEILKAELHKGALAHGYEEDYWSCQRIAKLICDRFSKEYAISGVWRLMKRLGWSSQKPQRRSLTYDPQAVTEWMQVEWPRIKKAMRKRRNVGIR